MKLRVLCAALCFASVSSHAQLSCVTIGDSLSTSARELGRAIGTTTDGKYIIAGSTESYAQGIKDVYVVKINGAGDTLWTTVVGGPEEDSGESIAIAPDDGAYISGYLGTGGGADILVMRIDANGGVLWSKTYGTGGTNRSFSVIATAGGGCAVAGVMGGSSVVIRLDATGAVQWVSTLSTSSPTAYALVQDDGGNFMVTGTYHTGVLLSKLDANGVELWRRTINPAGEQDECQSIITTADGGYALGGYTKTIGQGDWDMYVIKLASSGNVEWATSIGTPGEDYVETIVQDPDGGFTLAGSTGGDGCLVRLNAVGNSVIWAARVGFPGESTKLQGMLRTGPGGYACVGFTSYYASGTGEILLFSLLTVAGEGCCTLPFTPALASGYASSSELTSNTLSSQPLPSASLVRYHGADRTMHCADAIVLPVALTSFVGAVEGKQVRLAWTTATELNNDHFALHRSNDLLNFHHLVDVPGSGSSQVPIDYSALDEAPVLGVNYYRLSQFDVDGTLGYQKTIAVDYAGGEEFTVSVYPNPVEEQMTVFVTGGAGSASSREYKLEVNDAVGRPFIRRDFTGDRVEIDTSTLMSGTFEVRVLSCSKRLCRVARIVKLRKR